MLHQLETQEYILLLRVVVEVDLLAVKLGLLVYKEVHQHQHVVVQLLLQDHLRQHVRLLHLHHHVRLVEEAAAAEVAVEVVDNKSITIR